MTNVTAPDRIVVQVDHEARYVLLLDAEHPIVVAGVFYGVDLESFAMEAAVMAHTAIRAGCDPEEVLASLNAGATFLRLEQLPPPQG